MIVDELARHGTALRHQAAVVVDEVHAVKPGLELRRRRPAEGMAQAGGQDAEQARRFLVFYAASVLYWLGDHSEGRQDTRDFIDRRIDGVMQFEKIKASARKIPGVSMLTDLALGWVRAPKSADEKEKA